MKQTTFTSLAWSNKGKVTRRHRFLAEMDAVMGFTTVRYHGMAKNLAKAYAMFALANLYLVRRRLMPPRATCAL